MTSTLAALKARSNSKICEEKKIIDRKRELTVLLLDHLIKMGLLDTAEKLQLESGVSLSKFEVADNMDLMIILQHFYDYYETKYNREPKLVRKLSSDQAKLNRKVFRKETEGKRKKSQTGQTDDEETRRGQSIEQDLSVAGSSVQQKGSCNQQSSDHSDRLLLRPISNFLIGSSNDTKDLALTIYRDIHKDDLNVSWNDVVGLEDAKRLLNEAVVMPTLYPELFYSGGMLSPWKGVLLYGPPGTGKTLLAKAVASQCKTTFFNISASSIVSKYRGDSEKLVRVLFDLARYYSPSTIFLDEIDSIMGQRGNGGGGGEHEASRRMKTELLIQMDGLSNSNNEDQRIFILAASNLPWELDIALLRRLEKRVYVELPGSAARRETFQKLLQSNGSDDINYEFLAENTESYSCSDITLLCKEASMEPLRRFMKAKRSDQCKERAHLGKITMEDCKAALKRTKAANTTLYMKQYENWKKLHGSE